MKRIWAGLMFSGALALGVSCTVHASDPGENGKEKMIEEVIQEILSQGHYQPLDINQDLSVKAFKLYLERLDYGKQFLTQGDVDRITKLGPNMATDFQDGDFELLNTASSILAKRITEVKGFYASLLAKPFNFETNDSITVDADKLAYVKDDAGLRERWAANLKYQTLQRYLTLIESEKKEKGTFHADLEAQAREKVKESTRKYLDRIQKLDRDDNLAQYLNAIVNVYDPHTEYFPPADKENFDIEITGTLEGIGAQLREDDGFIKVSEIVPGSASWKQKELEPEDAILKVAQGSGEPVDVVGVSIDEAVKLIRGKKGTEVRLTVKKADGRIKVIPIVRDVVILEETYAKVAVITSDKSQKKFGYIDVPKFYTDFRHEGGPRAANDVRKILEQLKGQGVEGVVLDLRNNGGGSLEEAVNMAGLFIKQGPIVQVRDRSGRKKIHNDNDAAVVYDGTLVVLINSFSASASEIVSAALQDYNRAVVIGTPTSFGKGTVQQFVELDEQVNSDFDAYKPLGSLKLTIQKFYRINGASTQLNGVSSDIRLPDSYGYAEIGERELDYSLAGDTINAVPYTLWRDQRFSLTDILRRSNERIAANKTFSLINQRVENLKVRRANSKQSLNWKAVLKDQEALQQESEAITNSAEEIAHLGISPLTADGTTKETSENFTKELKKDIYLDEAISILNDMTGDFAGEFARTKDLK